MNAQRLTIVLGILLVALVGGLFGATYVGAGFMHTKANQLASDKAQVAQLTDQQSTIARSKKDIATYTPLEKITEAIVPQDKDQAETVRELTNIATTNGVTLTTITFPSSTLGATPGVATAASSLSQLTRVPTIPGVYSMLITIGNNENSPVTFTQLSGFLRGLRTIAVRQPSARSTSNHNPTITPNSSSL